MSAIFDDGVIGGLLGRGHFTSAYATRRACLSTFAMEDGRIGSLSAYFRCFFEIKAIYVIKDEAVSKFSLAIFKSDDAIIGQLTRGVRRSTGGHFAGKGEGKQANYVGYRVPTGSFAYSRRGAARCVTTSVLGSLRNAAFVLTVCVGFFLSLQRNFLYGFGVCGKANSLGSLTHVSLWFVRLRSACLLERAYSSILVLLHLPLFLSFHL